MRSTLLLFTLYLLLVSPLCTFAAPLQDTNVYPMPVKLTLRSTPAETLLVNSAESSTTESAGCRRLRLLGVRIRKCVGHMVSSLRSTYKQYAQDGSRLAGTDRASTSLCLYLFELLSSRLHRVSDCILRFLVICDCLYYDFTTTLLQILSPTSVRAYELQHLPNLERHH